MILKLLLLPAVWFQGAQSTITGGSSSRHGATCRFICELQQIMPCVLITALGTPVEPEVNRNLAIVSRPTRAAASCTSWRRLLSPLSDARSRVFGDVAFRRAITGQSVLRACSIGFR